MALNWIVNQATAAGVTMSATATTVAANPFVHDKSDSIKTGAPDANAEDREVRYRNGSKTTQREMTPPAGMSFADTQNFIDYAAIPLGDPQRTQFKTGTVDMKGYLQWLNSNGYGITLTAP